MPERDPSASSPPTVPKPRRSLRAQLLIRLLPPLLLLFAISGVLAYEGARHHANEVQDRWLVDSAEALAQRVMVSRGRPALDLPEAARQILQWDPEDTTWYEVKGTLSGHIAGHASVPDRPAVGAERVRQATMYDGWIAGAKVRVATVTLFLEGAPEAIEVRVAETLRKRQMLATEILLSVLVPQIALDLVAVAVIWFTLKQRLSPIGEVAQALQMQTHHSLEPVDDRALPTEMSPLTQALNELLLRLKSALTAQRHFIADAAHQLRTPLTALKLHADEAALESDPARLRPLIHEVQRAADRAVHLSNQLLALARAEPSARIGEPRPFDLRQVAFEAASAWVPRALQAGIDLGFGPEPASGAQPAWMAGDPELLGEAVHNLIDNAIRYGGPGTRITVSVEPVGADRLRLRVDDDGPGIALEDRTRVLERFQRATPGADAPRPRTSGAGLGLAIVTEIARAHDGQVLLRDGLSGRGSCIDIELPRLQGDAHGRSEAAAVRADARVAQHARRAGDSS